MIPDEQHENLESQVREILEAADWTDASEPDYGRIEVIAYRAALEAARMTSAESAGGSGFPLEREALHPGQITAPPSGGSVRGPSLPSSSRHADDRTDPDPCPGSARA